MVEFRCPGCQRLLSFTDPSCDWCGARRCPVCIHHHERRCAREHQRQSAVARLRAAQQGK